MSQTRFRRKVRRAFGAEAADAMLDVQSRQLELDRFLLLQHSLRRRLWWLITGRF